MQPAGERDISQAAAGPVRAQTAVARESAPSISVETLIWVCLVLVGALLRLIDLDNLPFTTDEAARSLDAVRVADGQVPENWRGDLSATVTSYAFRIFGETEVVARLVPAVAGLGLVATLWWTRPHCGPIGALVAAVLVTFSPLFVLHSRTTTEYAIGPLLSLIIVVTLFSYLRNPRIASGFPLFLALALALLTDAIAVLTALALFAFILVEGTVLRGREIAAAGKAFLSSPMQLLSALAVLAAGIQLGVTRFGTSLEAGLPGLALVGDLFDSPAHPRAAEYHLAVAVGYEWPLLLGGAAGFLLLAGRFIRGRPLSAFERFLLVWALTGVFTLALVTPGPAGQLLVLLLPLALIAGRLAQELVVTLDRGTAGRWWWPVAAGFAAIVALAALLMTEWSSGNASSAERIILAATPLFGLALLAVAYVGSRAATRIVVPVVAVVAAVFVVHSSLALAFTNGSEYAIDARLTPRADQLRDTIDRLSAERNSDVLLDAELSAELGWALRDSRVVFGGNPESTSILVTRPDAVPPGYAGLTDTWRVAEGWYPDEVLAPRRMWRWFLYREPFGPIDFVDVRIFVRTI